MRPPYRAPGPALLIVMHEVCKEDWGLRLLILVLRLSQAAERTHRDAWTAWAVKKRTGEKVKNYGT